MEGGQHTQVVDTIKNLKKLGKDQPNWNHAENPPWCQINRDHQGTSVLKSYREIHYQRNVIGRLSLKITSYLALLPRLYVIRRSKTKPDLMLKKLYASFAGHIIRNKSLRIFSMFVIQSQNILILLEWLCTGLNPHTWVRLFVCM